MKYEGLWTLVSAHGFDAATFERVWLTNEELVNADEENPLKMMANAMLEIKEESPLFIYCDMTEKAAGAPEEEINKAIEAGQCVKIDGKIMMIQKKEWKEENGEILLDSGERGEFLGEAINPFKPIVEEGNTIIIDNTYQFVRFGEKPTVVKKTVKVVKEGTPEMKEAAGTYIGQYTKFVGDPEDSRNTEKPFKLVLNDDGTGMSYRNDLEINIPDWTVENGEFKLTEKFLGTIDYTGKLDGKNLTLFNGEPTNAFTCKYVFVKE